VCSSDLEPHGDSSIAVGNAAKTKGNKAIAIGYNLDVNGDDSIMIGSNITASGKNNVIISNSNQKSTIGADDTVMLGNDDTKILDVGPLRAVLSSTGMSFNIQPKLSSSLTPSNEYDLITKQHLDNTLDTFAESFTGNRFTDEENENITIGWNIYNEGSGCVLRGGNFGSLGSNNIIIGKFKDASENWNLDDENHIIIGSDDSKILVVGPNSLALGGSSGITFNQQPKIYSSLTLSATNDIITKKYVDDSVGAVSGSAPDLSGLVSKSEIYYSGDITESIVIQPTNTWKADTGMVQNTITTNNCINIGGNPFPGNKYDSDNILIGRAAFLTRLSNRAELGTKNVVIGSAACSQGDSSVVVGYGAKNEGGTGKSVVIGYEAETANNGIAIGYQAKSLGSSIAIGEGVEAAAGAIVIGQPGNNLIKLGPNTLVLGGTTDDINYTGIVFQEHPKIVEGSLPYDIATKKYVDDKVAVSVPDISNLVSKDEVNVSYPANNSQTIQFGNGTSDKGDNEYREVRINFGRLFYIKFVLQGTGSYIGYVEFGCESPTIPNCNVKLNIPAWDM
jgi:hypothetical protein